MDVELERPFPRRSYPDVMARYGSDRPDTRIQLEIVELSDIVAESGFKVFSDSVASGGVGRGHAIGRADHELLHAEIARGERLDQQLATVERSPPRPSFLGLDRYLYGRSPHANGKLDLAEFGRVEL